jgi:hypothetical protein
MGVTLVAANPLEFKKLVSGMRFDEVASFMSGGPGRSRLSWRFAYFLHRCGCIERCRIV